MPPHIFQAGAVLRWSLILGVLATLIGAFEVEARALCIYDGKLYAKTTDEQEFRDAALVVRAKVISGRDTYDSDDEDPGVVYRIEVEHRFKGKTPAIISDYTHRDSGAFYLEVGREYLLFLNPISPIEAAEDPVWKKQAPEAMMVNYNCGQSRSWAHVSRADREKLATLSRRVIEHSPDL